MATAAAQQRHRRNERILSGWPQQPGRESCLTELSSNQRISMRDEVFR
jgi:hypothetical protein